MTALIDPAIEVLFLDADGLINPSGLGIPKYSEPVDVEALVSRIRSLEDPATSILGIEISYHYNADVPFTRCCADLSHVFQAIDEQDRLVLAGLGYVFSELNGLVTLHYGPESRRDLFAEWFEWPTPERFEEFELLLKSEGFVVVPFEQTLFPYSGLRDNPAHRSVLPSGEPVRDQFSWFDVLFR